MNKGNSEHFLLRTYKMTNDSGFAPNPFFGVMTLATCKAGIRKIAKEGEWIAGFTSKEMDEKTSVGEEKLVYLMHIDEPPITMEQYSIDSRFDKKKVSNKNQVTKNGDNIYFDFRSDILAKQLKNSNHNIKEKEKDLSGKRVLISYDFYYFGGYEPLEISKDIRAYIKIPKCHALYGYITRGEFAEKFIKYVKASAKRKSGLLNRPYTWKNGDDSWKKFIE